MAANTEILREYLVALGFRIDQTGERKTTNALMGMDKKAARLGKTLAEVGVATVALTHLFAVGMERMFYSARYADTTVGKLQALEFGARNVGLAGGRATALVKGMAEAVRANPGLLGLLQKLGVPVKGRTMDQVMLDFVRATKSMPQYVAQRYAGLFGIDPESLYYMQQGLDQMEAAARKRDEMAKSMGVDADAAAQTAREYMNMWRDVTEQASVFAMAIGTVLLPKVRELVGITQDLMHDWARIAQEIDKNGSEEFWKKIRIGLGIEKPGGGVVLSREAADRTGQPEASYEHSRFEWFGVPRAIEDWHRWRDMRDKKYIPRKANERDVDASLDMSDFRRKAPDAGDVDSPGGPPENAWDPQDYLRQLEKRYGLPRGILDRVWKRESNRGDPRFMRSPAGAEGHFGFMPKTAKEYGLKDPDDFTQSADAAARKWHDLMLRYKGDVRLAAAAYNLGDGNLARVGYDLGRVPKETRDYVDAVAGGRGGVNVNTEVHVHGVSDPQRAAESVVRKQQDVAADAVRNLRAKVR